MEEYTLSEAAKLKGKFIYGYKDLNGFFYIGKTTNPARRFYDNCQQSYNNIYLLKRLREAGDDARLVVIERDPPNLHLAEQAAIVKYAPQLTNIHMNPFRHPEVGVHYGGNTTKPLCLHCEAEIAVKKSKYCYKCLGALLGAKGQSKQELRELCKEIQTKRSGGCVI